MIQTSIEKIKPGVWFKDSHQRNARRMMKIQDVLPSGMTAQLVAVLNRKTNPNGFAVNAIDDKGTPCSCPYNMDCFYVESEDDLYDEERQQLAPTARCPLVDVLPPEKVELVQSLSRRHCKRYFLFDGNRFVEVNEQTEGVTFVQPDVDAEVCDFPKWSNGQAVIAFREADEEPDGSWRFDVNFSAAFGREIGALHMLVRDVQGGFYPCDSQRPKFLDQSNAPPRPLSVNQPNAPESKQQVQILVNLTVEHVEGAVVTEKEAVQAATQAVEHAVQLGQQNGFDHNRNAYLSILVAAVQQAEEGLIGG